MNFNPCRRTKCKKRSGNRARASTRVSGHSVNYRCGLTSGRLIVSKESIPPTPPVLSSPRVIAPHKFPICPRYEKEGGKKATELSMNDRRFGEAAANKNNKTARARDHATPSQPGLLFEKLEELGEIGSFLPLDFKLRVSSVGQTKKSLQLPRRSRPILATLFRYTLSRAPGHSQPFFRLITTYFGKSFFEPPSRDLPSLPREDFIRAEKGEGETRLKKREREGEKKRGNFLARLHGLDDNWPDLYIFK